MAVIELGAGAGSQEQTLSIRQASTALLSTDTSCESTQQMTCLHKDGAPLFAEGLVQAHVGTSDP